MASPPPALTWSATDHSQFIAASGITAVRTNVPYGGYWQSARSDLPQFVGQRYVEFYVDQIGSGVMVGVANGQASMGNTLGDNNSVAYWSNGNTLKNGTWGGVVPGPFTTGDTIGMLVDLTAHTVKFRKNGGAYSATLDISSLGPLVYPAVTLGPNAPATSIHVVSDNWNDFPAPTLNIVAHGDSITLGGVQEPIIMRLADLLEANRAGLATWTRLGIAGVSWNFAWNGAGYPYTLNQDAPLRVDPARSTLPNWLIAFAGTNAFAIQHQTAANEYAALQSYVSARISAGWTADHIIVCAMLPRTGVSETVRADYNARIVADAGALGYRVARLDLDPDIGAAGQNTNTTWFLDGTHPTDAGHARIAQILYALMFP